MMYGLAGAAYGFGPTGAAPTPGNFNLRQQEWQLKLTDQARELGFTTQAVGTAVRGLFDGAFAGEFKLAEDTIDIRVLPRAASSTSRRTSCPSRSPRPRGRSSPSTRSSMSAPALAPQDIVRIEELPAVTIPSSHRPT
jgi:HAE1 family hydrophobic/amphiphilic exporter-1